MKKRNAVTWLVVTFVSVVAAALSHVSLRIGVVRLGYAVSERTRERRALEEQYRQLAAERAFLRTPERVERLAREKLGMAQPDPSQIRVVRPGVHELASVTTIGERPRPAGPLRRAPGGSPR